MRTMVFLLVASVLLMSSCSDSNKEKAEDLVKEKLKSTLFHPETYKPISTEIDSAFINLENMLKVTELCEELSNSFAKQDLYAEELKMAESSMSIYAPSGFYYSEHSRVEYNQYKKECEELKAKLDKVSSKITRVFKELKKYSANVRSKEFTAWIVEHKFTSMNGNKTANLPGDMIFFCDKNLTKCGNGMEREYFDMFFKFLKKLPEAETEDDAKEIMSDFYMSNEF